MFLTGWVLAVALLLVPVAWNRSGSGGLAGLAIAAAVCLGAGVLTESLAFGLRSTVQPLGIMLLGMAIRMAPPLTICLALAAQRVNGREHLAFIAYLLTFYVITLALETWNAVHRIARSESQLNHNGAS